jgi:hypothetical protein
MPCRETIGRDPPNSARPTESVDKNIDDKPGSSRDQQPRCEGLPIRTVRNKTPASSARLFDRFVGQCS